MAEFAVALGVVNVYGCKDNDADPDFHNKHVVRTAHNLGHPTLFEYHCIYLKIVGNNGDEEKIMCGS